MENSIKLAMYACPGYKEDIEKRISTVAEAGFDAVALSFEQNIAHIESSPENQMMLAEKYLLPVEQVHLTGVDMNCIWEDGSTGDAILERTICELKMLKSFGLDTGVIHVTWGLDRPKGQPNAVGLARYLKITEEAEKLGIYVALENSVFSDYVAFLFDNIDSSHLGFCFDSGHKNTFTPSFDYLNRYGNRLITTHLHDNDGTEDSHAIPFDGTINWTKLTKSLSKISTTQKKITLECGKTSDEPIELWAKRAYKSAQKLADMITSKR